MTDADIHFYFDPLCPFAWMTSKGVWQVAAQRDYPVDWRFISLRMLDADVDYDSRFPAGYDAGHTAGRGCCGWPPGPAPSTAVRRSEPFTRRSAPGRSTSSPRPRWDRKDGEPASSSSPYWSGPTCPPGSPTPSTTPAGTANCGRKTDEALALTGKDVGTPIIHFGPPRGIAFFGPVISRLPTGQEAIRLWDHVVGLASFPASPSSSAACGNGPSSAASASTPARPASRRTGTAEADASRNRTENTVTAGKALLVPAIVGPANDPITLVPHGAHAFAVGGARRPGLAAAGKASRVYGGAAACPPPNWPPPRR
jgi:hypothetical protein